MTLRSRLAALAAAAAVALVPGCAITRPQETVGAYVDDSAITSTIKSRMVEDKAVDAVAINVETLNGNVQLSGFAKDRLEKQTAESIAMKVKGVKSVQNNITVRP
jgi:hyperosmotically inducible periplasmic protein